ncbi:MAG: DNA repair protein RadC, partial [Gammaproteobacteria bacterium]|nr:DNA repair protein RadC [Gammaproteobacteria bacterium]
RGAESLSNAELLAIFIHCGTRDKTAVDIGHDLLVRFKSIKGVVETDVTSLCKISGIGPVVYSQIVAALELGRRYLEEKVDNEGPMTSPDVTRQFLKSRLLPYQHEVFSCLFMDNRHRLITFKELFAGTIDGASVYPREVVKLSLKYNAAAVIFAHNHPSGVAEPSQSDIQITRRLIDALLLVDVRVLDHLIIGNQDIVSLAERGLM